MRSFAVDIFIHPFVFAESIFPSYLRYRMKIIMCQICPENSYMKMVTSSCKLKIEIWTLTLCLASDVCRCPTDAPDHPPSRYHPPLSIETIRKHSRARCKLKIRSVNFYSWTVIRSPGVCDKAVWGILSNLTMGGDRWRRNTAVGTSCRLCGHAEAL